MGILKFLQIVQFLPQGLALGLVIEILVHYMWCKPDETPPEVKSEATAA